MFIEHISIKDLKAYVKDELDPSRKCVVDLHLSFCIQCSRELKNVSWGKLIDESFRYVLSEKAVKQLYDQSVPEVIDSFNISIKDLQWAQRAEFSLSPQDITVNEASETIELESLRGIQGLETRITIHCIRHGEKAILNIFLHKKPNEDLTREVLVELNLRRLQSKKRLLELNTLIFTSTELANTIHLEGVVNSEKWGIEVLRRN